MSTNIQPKRENKMGGETLGQKSTKRKFEFSLDKISFSIIFGSLFLLPIFFLTAKTNISLEAGKIMLLSMATVVAFFLWLVARLKIGTVLFPKSPILLGGAIVVVVTLVSAFFSAVPKESLLGIISELGTFSSILILFLIMFLTSIFFQEKKRVFYFYTGLFITALISFIFLIFTYLYVQGNLPVEWFVNLPQNLVGKWNDVAILFGLVSFLSLATLELMQKTKQLNVILLSTLGISLLVLAIINFMLVWVMLGVFALVLFVYAMSFGSSKNPKERVFPTVSFTVALIALFFALANGPISSFIFNNYLQIPQEVLRPSWTQTFEIARGALSEDPILGVGPNRFSSAWLMFKADDVNLSALWNTDFNNGVGIIPSFLVTTGVVGIVSWLVFFGLFLYRGVKVMLRTNLDRVTHYLVFSSFLGALFLWISAILYVPNISIIGLAFALTGIFIAVSVQTGVTRNYSFSYLEDPRIGFVSVLVLIMLIMASVGGGYLLGQRFTALAYSQSSLSSGSIIEAQQIAVRTISLSGQDIYYRRMSSLNIARLQELLTQQNISEDVARAQFQLNSADAINNAVRATEVDETDYLNWIALGRAYEALIPLGLEQSYERALQSYNKAQELNPKSPEIVLIKARLELSQGGKDRALELIGEAMTMKSNYTDAIFLFSQIQAADGNLTDAIAAAEIASLLSPNNIGIFFQLGFLRYSDENYVGAISAFESAVRLNPTYSNAKYFLGLSYEFTGRYEEAIAQFKDIVFLDPSSTEAASILNNLENGKSPFSSNGGGSVVPPEERDEPPLDEEIDEDEI